MINEGNSNHTPEFGAYPAGGDFGFFDPSYFGYGRSAASGRACTVYSSTSQLASSAPELGYRLTIDAAVNNYEREAWISGYFIDDDASNVAGHTYQIAEDHFLKTASVASGNTSETTSLDLPTLTGS